VWWLDVWVLYAWVYAATVVLFPFSRDYATLPLQISMEAECRLFMVYLVVFVLLMKSNLSTEKIRSVLGRLGIVAFLLSLFALPFDVQFISGIVPNKSMNAIFVSALLPFVMLHFSGRLELMLTTMIAFFAITYFSNSSSGILAGFVVVVASLQWSKETWKEFISVVAFAAVPAILYLFTSTQAFNGTGRMEMYRVLLSNLTPVDYLIGKGPGTFQAWGAYVQAVTRTRLDYGFFLFMHSDPIQYFIEYGVLGLCFIALPVYYLLKSADRLTRASLLALLSGSLFYYPFHFPVHVIVFFLLAKISFNSYTEGYIQ
jgi:hypothetical protein